MNRRYSGAKLKNFLRLSHLFETKYIHISDPRDRVDTGFQQSVRIKLVMESPTMCSTVIQLNETHTMKGEQEIVDMPKKPDMIYFGLMPHKLDPEVDIVHSGFQGCMNYLQVS